MKEAPHDPESRLRCVHFLSEIRSELGGVVQAVIDLCQALAAGGNEVALATCDATDAPPEWTIGQAGLPRVVELERSPLTKALGAKVLSSRGARGFMDLASGAEVVHLHTPWALANYQLGRRLHRERIPYAVTVHGMLDDWSMQQKSLKKRLMLSLQARRFFEQATTVHFTAQGELEQAKRWIPLGDRGAVQPCLLDLTAYDNQPGPEPALDAFPQIDPEKTKLLFLSRLHPKKGVEILIEAGALLRDEGLPVQLLIVGPGDDQYLAELHALVDKLGMQEETLFLGMVRGVVKRSIFQAADVFVLPTYQENFGLAITEAMACGTPVVTTRGTDIWREIERGGTRIADHTAESFAEHLRPFCTDPGLSERVGQQGNRFVREWLDRDAVTRGYEQLYRSTIERGAGP